MLIVHVASEMFPYVKTGGLADVVGALSAQLSRRGHEVVVYLPGYRAVRENPLAREARRTGQCRVRLGRDEFAAEIWSFTTAGGVTVKLVVRDEFYDRSHLYWNGERDYDDNDARFIFFAKAVVADLQQSGRVADTVHAHDWQAGLVPLSLRHAEQRSDSTLVRRTLFTIHNIAYQGLFPFESFDLTNLPASLRGIDDGIEFYGKISLLKAGILFADRVTTVSPNYAREICTPEHGAGLDGVLRSRGAALSGIVNGIDTEVWNPTTDAALPARFSAEDLRGKEVCRAELLRQVGWDAAWNGPLFAMISRMTAAKGHDLVLAAENFFARNDVKLVVLGTGDAQLERAFRELAARLPEKIALSVRLDEKMSHLVEAGADFFLMPSRAEPCGLNQMYSQTYGTIPLCGRVGGLVDTVSDAVENPERGTGFLFAPTRENLEHAMTAAIGLKRDPSRLDAMRQRAMQRDFSWDESVKRYELLYNGA